ncbi:hypothetical protein DEU56DRAFT_235002 [Suillus clintonianus]|uniref:uncharacterized protein n=1 Tax=Suillus clintonianus TaxID=1904413 RepID=UPI001B87FBFE|nr:uncharacterized protein DEU56DRAFT_235002 [Suillus clintonianus]KAG2156430.1 hypothetical protein DEU56DRAFT_235002 [Suillus clintonianus]
MSINSPLGDTSFTLDTSGVMGFFGGEEAISAMATVHLYRGRRWLGWYNSPGSYTVAKKFGQLAKSRFWDGIFPGPNPTPEEMFGLDGNEGPRFIGVFSGTDMTTTGHLAYLSAKKANETKETKDKIQLRGRVTAPGSVSIIDVSDVKLRQGGQVPRRKVYHSLFAAIPIASSVATCLVCAFVGDWRAFGLIILGMVSSGLSCFVIGSGKLYFKLVEPSSYAPRGDGFLLMRNDIVILKGAEKEVTSITKAKLVLDMGSDEEFNIVGFCSLLLLLQFLVQLLFISRATLFGQIMFLSSLAVSWAYNSFLSSLEKEKIQTDLLWKSLGEPPITKFALPNRGSQAACACFVLYAGVDMSKKSSANFKPKKILECMIPNDTRVWEAWREHVAKQVLSKEKIKSFTPDKELVANLEDEERQLLEQLLADAKHGYGCYQESMGSWSLTP